MYELVLRGWWGLAELWLQMVGGGAAELWFEGALV